MTGRSCPPLNSFHTCRLTFVLRLLRSEHAFPRPLYRRFPNGYPEPAAWSSLQHRRPAGLPPPTTGTSIPEPKPAAVARHRLCTFYLEFEEPRGLPLLWHPVSLSFGLQHLHRGADARVQAGVLRAQRRHHVGRGSHHHFLCGAHAGRVLPGLGPAPGDAPLGPADCYVGVLCTNTNYAMHSNLSWVSHSLDSTMFLV